MSCLFVNKVYGNCNKIPYVQKNKKWCNLELTFQKKMNISQQVRFIKRHQLTKTLIDPEILTINSFLINFCFPATEIKYCSLLVFLSFDGKVRCWNREHSTANIVLFSTSEAPDILYISDKYGTECNVTNVFQFIYTL